ncbi:alpha/beta hydrolase [Shewanella algae]|uniref:alpha/beta hydrolase n=1 Tax=Shewanella algae TaxID=38313 RepID=UPI0031F4EAE2
MTGLETGIQRLVDEFIAAGRPNARLQPLNERRQGYEASAVLAGPAAEVCTQELELEGIRLRRYQPDTPGPWPTLIYFHGGCFVAGSFVTHEQQLSYLACHGKSQVIAVDYRLAPEHCYPAAHDDALKATQAILAQAAQLQLDPDSVTLGGDSAGGHLALVTCLRLKQLGWQPKRQLLIYPMLDATAAMESYRSNGDDFIITRDALLSGFEAYQQGSGVDANHPEISPLYREDFQGLCQTHIITAEFDPLRDEGEALYRKLVAAGVDARACRFQGVIHGFFQLADISSAARECLAQLAAILRRYSEEAA